MVGQSVSLVSPHPPCHHTLGSFPPRVWECTQLYRNNRGLGGSSFAAAAAAGVCIWFLAKAAVQRRVLVKPPVIKLSDYMYTDRFLRALLCLCCVNTESAGLYYFCVDEPLWSSVCFRVCSTNSSFPMHLRRRARCSTSKWKETTSDTCQRWPLGTRRRVSILFWTPRCSFRSKVFFPY